MTSSAPAAIPSDEVTYSDDGSDPSSIDLKIHQREPQLLNALSTAFTLNRELVSVDSSKL